MLIKKSTLKKVSIEEYENFQRRKAALQCSGNIALSQWKMRRKNIYRGIFLLFGFNLFIDSNVTLPFPEKLSRI